MNEVSVAISSDMSCWNGLYAMKDINATLRLLIEEKFF